MSTKCQLLLFEALMMNLKHYSHFDSRTHYYDLTGAVSQIQLTEKPDSNREHDQIHREKIRMDYFERFFWILIKF